MTHPTCQDVAEALTCLAPPALAEDWDNPGFLVGYCSQKCAHVLVALDVLDSVVEEAVAMGADMIVCHHPMIFKGIKAINDATPAGKRLLKLITHGIAVYAAHTNLDVAEGGTNDTLFNLLGLLNKESLEPPASPDYPFGCGRVGNLPQPMTLTQFGLLVKQALQADHVTITGQEDALVQRVGLCTGASGNERFFNLAARQGCDVYVTGDVTHHNAQAALDLGLCLVDATHYHTEVIVTPSLCSTLTHYFAQKGFSSEQIRFTPSQTDGRMFKMI